MFKVVLHHAVVVFRLTIKQLSKHNTNDFYSLILFAKECHQYQEYWRVEIWRIFPVCPSPSVSASSGYSWKWSPPQVGTCRGARGSTGGTTPAPVRNNSNHKNVIIIIIRIIIIIITYINLPSLASRECQRVYDDNLAPDWFGNFWLRMGYSSTIQWSTLTA